MPNNKTLQREIEVAFSKYAQPLWFRMVKYIFLGCMFYMFWGKKVLWITLLVIFVAGLLLHFWYRYKTGGWTKSYGMWNSEKNRPGENNP